MQYRETVASELKANVRTAKCLVLHWDGKLLPKIDNAQSGNVERLPVVVSGLNTMQLLGVPMLEKTSGEIQAVVITETLNEWNLSDRITALCFDTASINTGTRVICYPVFPSVRYLYSICNIKYFIVEKGT